MSGQYDTPRFGGAGWSPRHASHREEIGQVWSACGAVTEWHPLRAVLLHRPGAAPDRGAGGSAGRPDAGAAGCGAGAGAARTAGGRLSSRGWRSGWCGRPGKAPPNLLFVADLLFMTPEERSSGGRLDGPGGRGAPRGATAGGAGSADSAHHPRWRDIRGGGCHVAGPRRGVASATGRRDHAPQLPPRWRRCWRSWTSPRSGRSCRPSPCIYGAFADRGPRPCCRLAGRRAAGAAAALRARGFVCWNHRRGRSWTWAGR